eukprot:TRINITY_DN12580_c0_g2_i2.p1 TRINITY_DN12580_c0_g2~~TRINITY_DN12580_c0_g2_i2.p1  ORF type:complete len:406 (-),score=106.79 TRINITY_DN12580_c0_g2_i2:64-1281(-)
MGVLMMKFALWKTKEASFKKEIQGAYEERIGSGSVRVMGVNPLGLAIGVKMFEFGHDVEMVSCTWVPDEKAEKLLETTRQTLLKIHAQANPEAHALNDLEFRLAEDRLDHELLRRAYKSLKWDINPVSPSFQHVDKKLDYFSDDEMTLMMKPLTSETDYVLELEQKFAKLIPKDQCVAVIFAYPQDEVNLMCCRLYMRYKMRMGETADSEHSQSMSRADSNAEDEHKHPAQKVLAVINDAHYAEMLSRIGVIPVYTLSSITELVSRIALTATMVVLRPNDLVDMIHPLEARTTCSMTIEETHRSSGKMLFESAAPVRPYPRNYHSGVSLTRESSMTEVGLLRREQSFHPFNELSSLSGLGLASPHVHSPEVRIPLSDDIMRESMTVISPRSSEAFGVALKRSGTL